jgi:trk system potassium uptake protein TrkA
VTVVGVKRLNQDFEHALPETRILPADLLIVSGPTDKIELFAAGGKKGRKGQ